jgi:hypothetical protein
MNSYPSRAPRNPMMHLRNATEGRICVMPTVSSNLHTARLGVAAVERVCAKASQVFRELVHADVGIDGFIEVVEGGTPTGFFVGVQIKSGFSYFNADKTIASLPANADHLAYWGSCHFPVIGVVHLEGVGTYWTLISDSCTEERILGGPYSISIDCETSRFTPNVLLERILPDCRSLERIPFTTQETTELLQTRQEDSKSNHTNEPWDRESTAFSITAPDAMVANAACRLSRYRYNEPKALQGELERRLMELDTLRVQKLIRATSLLLDSGSDQAAESIADLMSQVPGFYDSIAAVLAAGTLPDEAYEAAFQIIEFLTEEEPTSLRAVYSTPSSLNTNTLE